MYQTERGFESEYDLGRLDLCRISTKVCFVVCLAAAMGILLIKTIDLRIYGSSLAVLCVSRTETFGMHRKATGFSHFLAQSLCGRHPRSLPGNQSMKRAAFSEQAD
jgi:hypothetical protein